MMNLINIHLLFLAACSLAATGYDLPREVGQFYLKDAAFVEVFAYSNSSMPYQDSLVLYMSTFNPGALFIHDPVYYISSPGRFLDDVENWKNKKVKLGGANTAYWPNHPVQIPREIGGFDGVIQTSGFIPPGKTYGQLEFYNAETFEGPFNIASKSRKDYSYHWVVWKDVDGDGLKDCMTARFHVGTFGSTESELVWLKNPGNLGPNGEGWKDWEQFVILEGGPDVFIEFQMLEADGQEYEVMVTGELWTRRIMLYYVKANVPGAWADSASIKNVVIDEDPGVPFEAHFIDLNRDGVLEITSSGFHEEKKDGGNLYVYIQPEGDFRQPWQRGILAGNFTANQFFMGNKMTPGQHMAFFPSVFHSEEMTEFGPRKPFLSVSGDDDGKHYILRPLSEERDNFDYELQKIVDTGAATAGTQAIIDLDGDGYMEIVSAGYSSNTVYVHTFKEE